MDKNIMMQIANGIREVEDFCKENSHLTYDQMIDEVVQKIADLQKLAKENSIPIIINTYDLISKHCKEEESSSSYEEESSSSYSEEEEESSEW